MRTRVLMVVHRSKRMTGFAVFSLLMTILCDEKQLVASQVQESYLIRPERYKAKEIPVTPKGAEIFAVLVDFAIWSITEVSLERQHMEVDFILTVEWNDNRLVMQPNISSSSYWIGIGEEIDSLWSPTLTFLNCKGCSPITFKFNSGIPVYVNKKNGNLWAEVRLLRKFGCNIDLHFYPLDVQICPIQVYTGEDRYNVMILKHFTKEGERKVDSNMVLSEFAPPHIHTGHCTNSTARTIMYSCLELQFRFERLIGYHMTTSYLPTSFIVVLSWISFWLPPDVIPARIALGLTSLLTLATRLDNAQRNLPPVSYAKAIDVWMLACILLVSLSLVEFAICNYILRKGAGCCEKRRKTYYRKENYPLVIGLRKILPRQRKIFPKQHKEEKEPGSQQDESNLDKVSRLLFPVSFGVFNLIYWSYYLNASGT